MRDHRKIVFYDITEEDPYWGEALDTGTGIGEHDTGPQWEDWAILAQGPAVLTLKEQARRLLRSQGISRGRDPFQLRPRPRPSNYDVLVEPKLPGSRPGAPATAGRWSCTTSPPTGEADQRRTGHLDAPTPPRFGDQGAALALGQRAARLTSHGQRLPRRPRAVRRAVAPLRPEFRLAGHGSRAPIPSPDRSVAQAFGPELQAAVDLLKTGIDNRSTSVEDVMVACRGVPKRPRDSGHAPAPPARQRGGFRLGEIGRHGTAARPGDLSGLAQVFKLSSALWPLMQTNIPGVETETYSTL